MKINYSILLSLILFYSCSNTEEKKEFPENFKGYMIADVNVIDVETGEIARNQNILVYKGKVSLIASSFKRVEDLKVVEGKGAYVLPGMVDGHIHFFQTGGLFTRPDIMDLTDIRPYSDEKLFAKAMVVDHFKRYLQEGVTSIIDVGGPFYNFTIRDSIADSMLSPNVLVTGPLFSTVERPQLGPKDLPIIETRSKEAVDELFAKMVEFRPDYIKAWYVVSPNMPAEENFEIIKYLGDKADSANLPFLVHATQLKTAQLAVKAGADVLVHSVDDELISDSFATVLKKKWISYIPTLAVMSNYYEAFSNEVDFSTHELTHAHPDAMSDMYALKEKKPAKLPRVMQMAKERPDYFPKQESKRKEIMFANLRKLQEKGVRIVTGTDAGNIGTFHASSYWEELEMMREAGLSNLEIIQASTVNAARTFPPLWEYGEAAIQHYADLVLYENNPLDSLEYLKEVSLIIKEGKVIEPDTLNQNSERLVIKARFNALRSNDVEAAKYFYADSVNINGKTLTGTALESSIKKEMLDFRFKHYQLKKEGEYWIEKFTRITGKGEELVEQKIWVKQGKISREEGLKKEA